MASLQPANSLQIIPESFSLSAIILLLTYPKTGMHSPSPPPVTSNNSSSSSSSIAIQSNSSSSTPSPHLSMNNGYNYFGNSSNPTYFNPLSSIQQTNFNNNINSKPNVLQNNQLRSTGVIGGGLNTNTNSNNGLNLQYGGGSGVNSYNPFSFSSLGMSYSSGTVGSNLSNNMTSSSLLPNPIMRSNNFAMPQQNQNLNPNFCKTRQPWRQRCQAWPTLGHLFGPPVAPPGSLREITKYLIWTLPKA